MAPRWQFSSEAARPGIRELESIRLVVLSSSGSISLASIVALVSWMIAAACCRHLPNIAVGFVNVTYGMTNVLLNPYASNGAYQ